MGGRLAATADGPLRVPFHDDDQELAVAVQNLKPL